jgi:two-component system sensor histidine kinase KdpD
MLGDGVHDAEHHRELLATVREESDRLIGRVGSLVDLARIRAGALLPAREPTAIEDVIESVLHRMKRTLAGVSLRTMIRPDLPDVMLDPVQIDQVLTNVLENAVRFSPPKGDVLVAVAAWRDGVQVRVGDRGRDPAGGARARVRAVHQRATGADGGRPRAGDPGRRPRPRWAD